MTINIFFSSDNNYIQHLSIAIYSLLDNSSIENLYKIYILDNKISLKNKNKLASSLKKFKN